jgi:hypothetical protein
MPEKRRKRPADTSLAEDLLEGVVAIAAFTGIDEPRAYYCANEDTYRRSRSAFDGARLRVSCAPP